MPRRAMALTQVKLSSEMFRVGARHGDRVTSFHKVGISVGHFGKGHGERSRALPEMNFPSAIPHAPATFARLSSFLCTITISLTPRRRLPITLKVSHFVVIASNISTIELGK